MSSGEAMPFFVSFDILHAEGDCEVGLRTYLLESEDGLVDHGHQDGIGDESRRVLGDSDLCAVLAVYPPRCVCPVTSSPFLHASPKALARSSVASEVCKAGMISTSFLHDQPNIQSFSLDRASSLTSEALD